VNRRYFGTDGIRGPYGGPVVNEGFFLELGQAVARWLRGRGASAQPVLVGRDTRGSGPSLARAFGEGVALGGFRPRHAGVVPTPAVAKAILREGAALGCSVTASHNPAADNGIKFFARDGSKLSDADEAEIESLLGEPGPRPALPGTDPGSLEGFVESYVEEVMRVLPMDALSGWRVALDTANGATAVSSPAAFRALGAEVISIGDRPDGANINLGVGSEHPGALCGLALSGGARMGVAHDGDGDRCVLCDEKGQVLDGDEVLTLLALEGLRRGTLRNRTLVVTVQSNLGVDRAVEQAGGRVVRSRVGDRYVAELMRSEGASLGGESSGHIVNFDYGATGDGLVAALMVASVMLGTGRPLSSLRTDLRRFPQAQRALVVREKVPIDALKALPAAIRSLEQEFGAAGRVLVRYSGTEPKLRLLVEAQSDAVVGAAMDRLVAAARSELPLA